jgi:hypothetical protein
MVLCENIEGFGGGRGFIAVVDLPPGALLLAEMPVVRWDPEHSDLTSPAALAVAVETVVNSAEALEITQKLYPRVLEEADQEEVAVLRAEHTEIIQRIARRCVLKIPSLAILCACLYA